jgi:hypothetical protein
MLICQGFFLKILTFTSFYEGLTYNCFGLGQNSLGLDYCRN